MKAPLLLSFILVSLLFFSCQQNKAKAHQDAIKDMMDKNGDKKKENQPVPKVPPPSDDVVNSGLIGEWETILVTGDNNANGILDPQEREKGFSTYKDYLRLNDDGTCQYTVAKMDAVYEIIEKDGHKSIEIIVRDGSRMKQGRIISLKPDELQLMKFLGGRDIIVYKRL